MSLRHTALGLCLLLSACASQTGGPAVLGSRAESLVREGDALLAESNFEGAVEAYRDAIEADPEFARAYSRLAYAQLFHPACKAGRVGSGWGLWHLYSAAESEAILLATHVGGEPLAHRHGFPLRAVVPAQRGWFWVKWLSRVELVA